MMTNDEADIGSPQNALAGPSTLPDSPPMLFFPPQGQAQPVSYLKSTEDLLARFNLLPAYEKYVRPFVDNAEQEQDVKGKGKEKEPPQSPTAHTPGGDNAADADGDGDEENGRGDKKGKNSYKHLIKGVPGKHSMRKDEYLMELMFSDVKQRIPIVQFDHKTQRDAFVLSLDGIKGWNTNTLVLESAQAREDRKKRKELKRLAKAQALAPAPVQQAPAALSNNHKPKVERGTTSASTPNVARISTPNASRTSTPRPPAITVSKVERSAPTPGPRTPVTVARPATPASAVKAPVPRPSAVPRPSGSSVPRPSAQTPQQSSAVPRPGSAVPRPGTKRAIPVQQHQQTQHVAPPAPTHGVHGLPPRPAPSKHALPDPSQPQSQAVRGKKRGHEEAQQQQPSQHQHHQQHQIGYNGTTNGHTAPPPQSSKPTVNVKAGSAGARPRPIKKQRVDAQGQARDVTAPTQQPTPQGV